MRVLCFLLLLLVPCWAGEVTGKVNFNCDTGAPKRSPKKDMSVYSEAERKDIERQGAGGQPYTKLNEVDNVVVFLEGPGLPTAPPAKHAMMHQKDKIFNPHVLPVVANTVVEFPNDETAIFHHIYSNKPDFEFKKYRAKQSKSKTFGLENGEVPTVVELFCGIHALMNAYVVVLPNSCFSSTKNGVYRIQKVPAGTYTLKAWHPRGDPKLKVIGKIEVPESGKITRDIVWK